jgi:hypothetical protein
MYEPAAAQELDAGKTPGKTPAPAMSSILVLTTKIDWWYPQTADGLARAMANRGSARQAILLRQCRYQPYGFHDRRR